MCPVLCLLGVCAPTLSRSHFCSATTTRTRAALSPHMAQDASAPPEGTFAGCRRPGTYPGLWWDPPARLWRRRGSRNRSFSTWWARRHRDPPRRRWHRTGRTCRVDGRRPSGTAEHTEGHRRARGQRGGLLHPAVPRLPHQVLAQGGGGQRCGTVAARCWWRASDREATGRRSSMSTRLSGLATQEEKEQRLVMQGIHRGLRIQVGGAAE